MGELPRSLQESVDSSKAEYRQLGKSGLRVSVPILGAMSFGNSGWMDWLLSEDKALPILKAAYDRGLNTWDTANMYSNGESERIIGKAIGEYNIPRPEGSDSQQVLGLRGRGARHAYQSCGNWPTAALQQGLC